MAPSNLTEIDSVALWNQSLRDATAAGRTVVVDFHAVWCGPCKAIAPVYEKFAETFPQVDFLRVDVDAQKPIASKYRITAMPTFMAIKAGQPVDYLQGADPRGLHAMVTKHAGPNPPIPPLPEAAEAAKAAGNEYFKKGDYAQAIEKYSEAIAIVPNSAQLLANRSISYLKSTPPNHSAAVDDARQATVVDPKWGKGWIRLGDALLASSGSKEEVEKAYETGLKLFEEGGTMWKEANDKLSGLKST